MKDEKWDIRYLKLAKQISEWSKDPSTKVGAVLVREDNTVAGIGYNGFPSNMMDTEERLNDRETKYSFMIHAEINAILNAHEPAAGHTLYLYPICSCPRCAVHVAQSKIKRVVFTSCPDDKKDRWEESIQESKNRFDEAKVEWMEIPIERVDND